MGRAQGYALLYALVSKQAGVDKSLVVGTMGDPTKSLVKQIAQVSGEAVQQLKQWSQADGWDLKQTGLPAVERAARESEESRTTRDLLFAGKKFELRLLISQSSATSYGWHLARELAKMEGDETRKAWLDGFAERYEDLHKRVEQCLSVAQ